MPRAAGHDGAELRADPFSILTSGGNLYQDHLLQLGGADDLADTLSEDLHHLPSEELIRRHGLGEGRKGTWCGLLRWHGVRPSEREGSDEKRADHCSEKPNPGHGRRTARALAAKRTMAEATMAPPAAMLR